MKKGQTIELPLAANISLNVLLPPVQRPFGAGENHKCSRAAQAFAELDPTGVR